MDLTGKVALVTGASRGIGRAAAIELAAQGAKVAVNYVSSEAAAQAVVAAIAKAGGEAVALQADVADPAGPESLVAAVTERWGRLDILVNNAGITRDGLVMRMALDDWDAVLRTNLTGPFLCAKAALRPMVRQRAGRIINLSSIVGDRGNAGQANYAAAKAGLIGFTKSLAKEVASRSITVNALTPGWIETDMVTGLPEELRTKALDAIPMGRYGTPEDVAAVIAFLASDAAGYVTGQVIGIDGAMVL